MLEDSGQALPFPVLLTHLLSFLHLLDASATRMPVCAHGNSHCPRSATHTVRAAPRRARTTFGLQRTELTQVNPCSSFRSSSSSCKNCGGWKRRLRAQSLPISNRRWSTSTTSPEPHGAVACNPAPSPFTCKDCVTLSTLCFIIHRRRPISCLSCSLSLPHWYTQLVSLVSLAALTRHTYSHCNGSIQVHLGCEAGR